jgi:osmotically-inducible protein OsmY
MTPKRILHVCLLAAMLLVALGAPGTASAQDKGVGFSDAVITELVKTAISNDPLLRNMDIAIATRDRVVRLSGFVHSMDQVDRAEALARRVEGVTAVRNVIRVANRPSRA